MAQLVIIKQMSGQVSRGSDNRKVTSLLSLSLKPLSLNDRGVPASSVSHPESRIY